MSLENELKKNTAALEAMTAALLSGVAAAPAAAAPAAPAAPAMMTPEEFNAELVAEMTRINKGREPIDTVMAQMGITSVVGLTAEQQTQLMTSVKAIL